MKTEVLELTRKQLEHLRELGVESISIRVPEKNHG
jgi:hypothetical protein